MVREQQGAAKDLAPGSALSEVDARLRAIEALYQARYVGFRNAVATVTGSYESARDAVQEGFARAIANREQLRDERLLAAWVWRMVFRAALELRGLADVPFEDATGPALVEPERDPLLAWVLAELPRRQRLVVFLRYFADFSYAEIAAALDVSEGTVGATLSQAREKLAEALEVKGVS
jgi:RNA polymerase sigma factor (sigma-70 family)